MFLIDPSLRREVRGETRSAAATPAGGSSSCFGLQVSLCGFGLAPLASNTIPMLKSPDLTLPLAQPITLSRGPRSHLVTLMDAAILIRDLEPWRHAPPVWDRVAEMILTAAECRKREDVQDATRQMMVALEKEK
jgi:hypothetical protein